MFQPSLNSCIEKLHFHPKEGKAQGGLRVFEVESKCTGKSLTSTSHDQGVLDAGNVTEWLTKACIPHTPQEVLCVLITITDP